MAIGFREVGVETSNLMGFDGAILLLALAIRVTMKKCNEQSIFS
ncbi:hypothetical protein [Leptolyngbya sp. FACHB-261]|nr:hypothetical protein [Leptolyngbya sp. FACHB-261]